VRTGEVVGGRYELEDALGSGGGGIVWTAFDRKLKRTVALKRPHLMASQADRLLFRREAEAAARVQHPNAISIFDTVEGDECWLVMEYSPAESLDKVLAVKGTLPPERVARIGAQVAAALAAVHASRIMHRDVKPGNILVTNDDGGKLTDFGISIWCEVTRTEAGPICGTPAYTAPEVARGLPATEASDVFSLGATLFAAVEGAPPAGRGHPDAVLERARRAEVPQPRRAGPLAPLLREMLDPSPVRRPSASEVRSRLMEFVGDWQPSSPLPGGKPVRIAFWRRPLYQVAAALLAITTVVTAVAALNSGSTPDVFGASSIGDEQTADPCALLDPNALASLGQTQLHTAKGNFNRCDVVIDVGSAKELDVEVQLLLRRQHPVQGLPFEDEGPPANDGSECVRVLMLGDKYGIQVSAKLSDPKINLCTVADTALDTVKQVLRRGPLQRRDEPLPADSLAHVNACGLLDSRALAVFPSADISTRTRGFGDWSCKWYSPADRTEIHLRYDQHAAGSPVEGVKFSLGDHEAYLDPGSPSTGCTVHVRHQPPNPAPRPTYDLVALTVKSDQAGVDHCATVTSLAGPVAAALPR
jgi:serine/threonine protein kinase